MIYIDIFYENLHKDIGLAKMIGNNLLTCRTDEYTYHNFFSTKSIIWLGFTSFVVVELDFDPLLGYFFLSLTFLA